MAKARLNWLVPAVITGALVPFASIGWRLYRHRLGANPVTTALNQVGLLALIFLVLSLSCTPLKIAFGYNWPLRIRKTLGLCGFFSALLHFSIYFALDQNLAPKAVLADVLKRPFIAVGFLALVLLVPLALTSTRKALAKLGFVRWQRLHRLVYLIGVLVAVHFYLRVKADHTQPLCYAAIIALGFVLRGAARVQKARLMRLRESVRSARSEAS